MRIWLFVLAALPLMGTVNKPLRIELSSGYRNDRIHWHLQNGGGDSFLAYNELSRDVQFWENALVLKTIHRDLSFFLRGSYGVFGKGMLAQKYADLSYATDQPHFQFETHGWCADVEGYFGYAVNLTADRTYMVILTPLLGLSGHFENLGRGGVEPNPWISLNAVGSNEYTMSSQAHPLHMTWWGFFLGGSFTVEPGGPLVFQVGYTYHWVRAHLSTRIENEVVLGSPPISETITSFQLNANEGGNLGQTGWAQIDYELGSLWRIGIGGLIHYYSSKVFSTNLNTRVETLYPAESVEMSQVTENFKLRWVPISGWVQISREI